MKKTKCLLFTASLVLATAFTLSCSSGDKDDGGDSSSSVGDVSSSSVGGGSSSSVGGSSSSSVGGGSSSSVGGGGSSSSVGGGSSSSVGGGSSSSVGGSSSSSVGGGGSSSSVGGSSSSSVGGGSSSSVGGGGSSSSVGGGSSSSVGGGDSPCNADFGEVKIGTQTWAKKNLNCDFGVNSCYGNDPNNCTQYGRLYDWETAFTACPSGWHLPSKAEWEVLTIQSEAGKKLKATGNGNGTDEFGFSALSGGYGLSNGSFRGLGDIGYWWSEPTNSSNYASVLVIESSESYAPLETKGRSDLYSVRCIKD